MLRVEPYEGDGVCEWGMEAKGSEGLYISVRGSHTLAQKTGETKRETIQNDSPPASITKLDNHTRLYLS